MEQIIPLSSWHEKQIQIMISLHLTNWGLDEIDDILKCIIWKIY